MPSNKQSTPEAGQLYAMDYVIAKKTYKQINYYLVKWAGYSFEECTWERETPQNCHLMEEEPAVLSQNAFKLSLSQLAYFNFKFILLTHPQKNNKRLQKIISENNYLISLSSEESESSSSDLESSVIPSSALSTAFIPSDSNLSSDFTKMINYSKKRLSSISQINFPKNISISPDTKSKLPLFNYITSNTIHKSYLRLFNFLKDPSSKLSYGPSTKLTSSTFSTTPSSLLSSQNRVCCTCTDYCIKGVCECSSLSSGVYSTDRLLQFDLLTNNNYLLIECGIQCSCHKIKCWNRVCQLQDTGFDYMMNPLLFEIKEFTDRGFGVVTKSNIKKGAYVMEYIGELIDKEEAIERGKFYDSNRLSYLMKVCYNKNKTDIAPVLDATFEGNLGRFVNHSCDPNLKVVLFCESGEMDMSGRRVAFFAKKYIRKGTELTIDYGYEIEKENSNQILCRCGSRKCRGRLL